ncbi:hypothetical protein D3C73_973160 [compost metagenome]
MNVFVPSSIVAPATGAIVPIEMSEGSIVMFGHVTMIVSVSFNVNSLLTVAVNVAANGSGLKLAMRPDRSLSPPFSYTPDAGSNT